MLSFRRKAGALSVTHRYYATAIDARDMFRLVSYYQVLTPGPAFGFVAKPFHTILNSLELPAEEILKGFTSTVRNEVRRSERENVQFGLLGDLEEFRRFQNAFADAKGAYVADKDLLDAYRGGLVLTCARVDEKLLAAHAYLCDAESSRVRLLLSSSSRLTDQVDANLVGRANKYLHFKDMLYFKERGFRTYDFGGIAYNTTDRQRQGINTFKQSFGGGLVQEADYQSWLYYACSRTFYAVAALKKRLTGNPA